MAEGSFIAPAGYLAYGNFIHKMEREKTCDVCHGPLITINPVQVRHEGKCAKEGRALRRSTQRKFLRVMRLPSTAKRGRPRGSASTRRSSA